MEPRITLMESVLTGLQERGAVRAGLDKHTVATLCFGSYFAAFYRGEGRKDIPETVAAVMWPAISAEADGAGRAGAGI